MGCAVACTASLLGIDYKRALKKFNDGERKHSGSGFYVYDIKNVLKEYNLNPKTYNLLKKKLKYKIGDIIFTKEGEGDFLGHYLLKTKFGWMDCWINYPSIVPAKSGYRKRYPGRALWLIRCINLNLDQKVPRLVNLK